VTTHSGMSSSSPISPNKARKRLPRGSVLCVSFQTAFTNLLFGTPTVSSSTLLELEFYVVVEVSNHQLSHNLHPYLIS
jgi:hypothetical protein